MTGELEPWSSELLRDAVANYLCEAAAPGTARWRTPNVAPARLLERGGYFSAFPQLISGLSVFDPAEAHHHTIVESAEGYEGWLRSAEPASLVLPPALCYFAYAAWSAQRLDQTAQPVTMLLDGDCYRHEPSADPYRRQTFRMLEVVITGAPEAVAERVLTWRTTGATWLTAIGLDVRVEAATDPFYGRLGELNRRVQRDASGKTEFVYATDEGQDVALGSVNAPGDHFSRLFAPDRTGSASTALPHTACLAFGVDRITTALLRRHGSVQTAIDAVTSRYSDA